MKRLLLTIILAGYAPLQSSMIIPSNTSTQMIDLRRNPASLQQLPGSVINALLATPNNQIITYFLTPEQISSINTANLTPEQLSLLTPTTFIHMSIEQLKTLNLCQLNQISFAQADTLAKHNMEKVAALTLHIKSIMDSTQFPPVTPGQPSVLNALITGPESKLGRLHNLLVKNLTKFVHEHRIQ